MNAVIQFHCGSISSTFHNRYTNFEQYSWVAPSELSRECQYVLCNFNRMTDYKISAFITDTLPIRTGDGVQIQFLSKNCIINVEYYSPPLFLQFRGNLYRSLRFLSTVYLLCMQRDAIGIHVAFLFLSFHHALLRVPYMTLEGNQTQYSGKDLSNKVCIFNMIRIHSKCWIIHIYH